MSPDVVPVPALVGGMLLGLAASVLLLGQGRVAGISGILGGLRAPQAGDVAWRLLFLAGLIGAGVVASAADPALLEVKVHRPPIVLALAGVLVGFGTRLGNGCASGHGVCGLSRFSPRSLVAVLTFMATGMLTATLVKWLGGVV